MIRERTTRDEINDKFKYVNFSAQREYEKLHYKAPEVEYLKIERDQLLNKANILNEIIKRMEKSR